MINRKIKDLTGQKFGKLTVIGLDDRGTRKTYWNCLCECGNIKSVRADSLQCGAIKSCGCLKKEQDKINLESPSVKKSREFGSKYGHIRIHNIWANMKSRCFNPKDARYTDYGGRGIKVCDEWKNDFFAFYKWAMENGYSENLTIDRIDNDGDYTPSNCRWVSRKVQSLNKSTNRYITYNGQTKTITQWATDNNMPYYVLRKRIDILNWDFKRAISEPPKKMKKGETKTK